MVSYLVKNKKSQATGIGQGPGSSANRATFCIWEAFLPFSQGFWDKFQRVSLGIWAIGKISISLCSSPISGLKRHLSLLPSLHTQLDQCFSNSGVFFTVKKKKKTFYITTQYIPPKHKALLKQYIYLFMYSDGFFSIPFNSIPFQNMLVVTHYISWFIQGPWSSVWKD